MTEQFDVEQALAFIALPMMNASVDRFLSDAAIEERPAFEEDSTIFLENKAGGFAFEFTELSLFEEAYGKAREKGVFIMSRIFVASKEFGDGYDNFLGRLPFDLKFGMSLTDAERFLGKANDEDLGDWNDVNWRKFKGYDLQLSFTTDSDRLVSLSIGSINQFV